MNASISTNLCHEAFRSHRRGSEIESGTPGAERYRRADGVLGGGIR
jgi:hypothetical protein